MSHITERPQADGTMEYDAIWCDPDTGRRKKYEADGKVDALRFKRNVDSQANHMEVALRMVLSTREAELLATKGPCSNPSCALHYAHSGPCA
jgi:hypothetical protein